MSAFNIADLISKSNDREKKNVSNSEVPQALTQSTAQANSAKSVSAAKQENVPQEDSRKRSGYISWDEYFMGVAKLSAMRSKDPNTQVGACIVSPQHKILSMGYNGFPTGCSDDEFPWNQKSADPYDNKYFYTTHSELNAILNYRGGSLEGSKMYVTLFPCNECAKAIIQSGIKTVIYADDKYKDTSAVRAAKRMFRAAGVRVARYNDTYRVMKITV